MNWINYGTEVPNNSGVYVVSLKIQRTDGIAYSNYVAYYDKEKNNWFKQDPFVNPLEAKYDEEIGHLVVGWIGDMMSYLGEIS